MSRTPLPPALLCVVLAVTVTSGCSRNPFAHAEDWLATACGEDAETTAAFDVSDELAEFAGGPEEQLACETGAGDLVQAFLFDDDPAREFLNIGDGWESGDGTKVEWATKAVDGDQWVGIYVHQDGVSSGDGENLLAPLADEDFDVEDNG